LANIKICGLQFLEPLFCAPYNHLLQSCINKAPLSNASGVLRQHHQALSQNGCIVTQHDGADIVTEQEHSLAKTTGATSGNFWADLVNSDRLIFHWSRK